MPHPGENERGGAAASTPAADADLFITKRFTYGPGMDNILSMTVTEDNQTNTFFYLKDHQNSVLAITDEAGQIVETYSYDAFGRTKVFDANGYELSASSIGNRFAWQGREIDWNSGLYYFRNRWYDPVMGRWLSNDPIGISGGLNQYVFCNNNPVNGTDPLGLCSEDGETYIKNYAEMMGKQWWNLFGSVYERDFDIYEDTTSYNWRMGTVKADWMGNVGVSYAFARTYGIRESVYMSFAGEIMQSTSDHIEKGDYDLAWSDAHASFEANSQGIVAAIQDEPSLIIKLLNPIPSVKFNLAVSIIVVSSIKSYYSW